MAAMRRMTPGRSGPFDLEGRTAFISGAAGHLGRVMAQMLAEAGARIILNGRSRERLECFATELKAGGHSIDCAPFDVADVEQVRHFFGGRPRIDILVNNAIAMTPKSFAALEAEDFERTYHSSVTAAFEIVRAAMPALRAAA